jgi:predicted ATPase
VKNRRVGSGQDAWSGARSLPYSGRDDLLDELDGVLRSAAGGRGTALLLEGEAGIGKTTVVQALVERVSAAPFVVAWATCPPEELTPPFEPWSVLLESVLTSLSSSARRHVVATAEDEVDTVMGAPSSSVEPGPMVRAALIHAVVGVLERAAHHAPLLLVIDDIREADVASLLLAARVATTARRHPIALLTTSRSGDARGGASRLTAQTEFAHASTTVMLRGLDKSGVGVLVERSGVSVSPEMIDVLMTRTNGNPFFITELLRLILSRGEQGESADQIVATEVPRRVSEALQSRLARLPETVVALLQAAAVLGSQGDLDTVAKVGGFESRDALALLESAAAAGMIALQGSRWRFAHALVRDALYETLGARRRSEIHGQALRAIGVAAPIHDRARHALAALPVGDSDEAVALATEAGHAAMDRLSFEEAARWFDSAVQVMTGNSRGPERARLLLARGLAERASGDADAAKASCRAAAELADHDPEVLASAALGYADPGADLGLAYQATDPRTALLLEQALASVPKVDALAPTRARLLARLASDLYFSSQADRSRALAEEAISLARCSGDVWVLVQALAVYHDAYVVGHVDAAEAVVQSTEMLDLARSTGDPALLLVAHRARVFDLLASGDLASTDAEISAFSRLADMTAVPAYQWWPAVWRAMRAQAQGQLQRAESLASQAFALGRSSFEGLALANLGFLAFFTARDRGRLEDLEVATREFAATNADIPAIGAALVLLLAETGKIDEAVGAFDALAAHDFGRLQDRNWPAAWFQLARAAYLTGAREHASVLQRLGRRFAGECVMVSLGTVYLGSADLGLAWLADILDRFDEADEHYRRAEATNQRLGARTWLAQARADHAGLLLRRKAPGDADTVTELAVAARAGAEDIGMEKIVAICDVILGDTSPRGESFPGVSAQGVFRKDGEIWTVAYHGTSARVSHAKGLADIARLLATPGQPVSAAELVALQAPGTEDLRTRRGDDVFDQQARQEIRARMSELDQALADAEDEGDSERAARVKAERDVLFEHLEEALGLGGRSRRLGDREERARKAVGVRIRHGIDRIEAVHPALGAHLRRSIDTGRWCVYRPERSVDWEL